MSPTNTPEDCALATPGPPDSFRVTSRLASSTDRRRMNQYVRRQRIGKGRHGVVYLCTDESGSTASNIEVAIKIVKRTSPRDKMKLLRKTYQEQGGAQVPGGGGANSTENSIRKEIAIMKRCRHVNLVRLLEVIDDPLQERIYIVMEYLQGGPVEWANADHQPILTTEQTRRIVRDVILGLEYLHHHGIIHRDIKPANLLYTHDRQCIKIIDFGVAHLILPKRCKGKEINTVENEDYALFNEGDLLKRTGTPSFLAPEVVWFPDTVETPPSTSHGNSLLSILSRNRSSGSVSSMQSVLANRPPITKAIDIWSLGVTFYCLLFGHTPFNVPSSANENGHHKEFMLYHQICTQDWTVGETMGANLVPTGGRSPSGTSTEGCQVIHILDRMLQKEARNRITVAELKRHPWFLVDIANPKEWCRVTSPVRNETSWMMNLTQKVFGLFPSPQ